VRACVRACVSTLFTDLGIFAAWLIMGVADNMT
jgi:hypothetical protein